MIRFLGRFAAAMGLLFLAIPAHADVPLTLTNSSFEIQNPFDQTTGCGSATPCYNLTIVDWNQFNAGPNDASGTFDPTLAVPAIAPPALNGNNVAFLNSDGLSGSVITQDLGFLTGGITYSIAIQVASRGPMGSTPQANYRLGAATGGTAAAPTFMSFTEVSGTAPANPTVLDDNWAPATVSFTPVTDGDWYAYIANDGAGGGGLAQLEVDSVPEPSALLLLAGMIGSLLLLRKRSQS